MKGLVVKNTGSWYTVCTDDGQLVESKIKGNFRLKGIRSTNPVAVGDRVTIVANQEGTAFITEIDDRKNYIIRKSQNLSKQSHILAANVDQALLVVTVNRPPTSTTFIDRFLASAEAYRVPVVLIFNKTDLLDDDEASYQEALIHLYTTIGYECRAISAETGEGVAELLPMLEGKITLLSGNSGVGKSTLINRLVPGADLRTSEISDAHNTGQHTTTFSVVPLIWSLKNSPAILRKSSLSRRIAAFLTVPTPTNQDVPFSRPSRTIILLKAATNRTLACLMIRTMVNIAKLSDYSLFSASIALIFSRTRFISSLSFCTLRFISSIRLLPFFDDALRNPRLFSYVCTSCLIASY